MAINTQVIADHNAPPISQILAKFISSHPSQGWDATVDHEAHRTFMNWLGCAVGAAHHESVLATLAAVKELESAPQASILGRAEKVDMASAKADTLNVSLGDVLAAGAPDILSGTSQVTITGDSGDVVNLSGGTSWTLAGTQTEGADTYMVYVNANAHLLVNDKIHLIIS